MLLLVSELSEVKSEPTLSAGRRVGLSCRSNASVVGDAKVGGSVVR